MPSAETVNGYQVRRATYERTIRLVGSARLRDPMLLKLVGQDDLAALAEIEGASSGRLTAHRHGTETLDPRELVAGVPHAAFINAAFSYWRPRDVNRFNGPGRGAWYSALDLETSIAEVSYHLGRELGRTGNYNAVVDYVELHASFAGEFVDLTTMSPRPTCLDPDEAIGYPAGNALATMTETAGHNGIVYPSVRRAGGTCLVALRPHAVQSVAQGNLVRLSWAGSSAPEISEPSP